MVTRAKDGFRVLPDRLILALDKWSIELAKDMLFMELTKGEGDWLWHSGTIGNKSKLGLGCLGEFVMERAKGIMENTGYDVMPIALCDSLLWTMIVVRDAWSLAPSFV
jgi:hypothetical protein